MLLKNQELAIFSFALSVPHTHCFHLCQALAISLLFSLYPTVRFELVADIVSCATNVFVRNIACVYVCIAIRLEFVHEIVHTLNGVP